MTVGFLGGLLSIAGSVFGSSKKKKAAAKAAADAAAFQAKQAALERELQAKRDAAAQSKQKWITKLLMFGGIGLVVILILFVFLKKRR